MGLNVGSLGSMLSATVENKQYRPGNHTFLPFPHSALDRHEIDVPVI